MKIGLVGLPLAGKTTLYNLLTGNNLETSQFYSGKMDANLGMAQVPDVRADHLLQIYKSKRVVNAQLEITDLPGLKSDRLGSGNLFLQNVRKVDALVHVIRAFDDANVEHLDGDLDPLRDFNNLNAELYLADLDFLEKRIERIQNGKKITPEHRLEQSALEKYLQALEEEQPLHSVELSEEEADAIKHYSFFSQVPQLVVINTDEESFKNQSYKNQEELDKAIKEQGYGRLLLSAKIEGEIAELPPEDRELFMEDLGLKETGAYRLAREMYALLGQISFFTVGENEVRVWTIDQDLPARKAAGKIHSDMERGFIRAEVVAYDDLKEHGSFNKCKEKGLVRLEGKEYPVKDGDVITIRFNV